MKQDVNVRKNIDLPSRTVKKLQKCADDFRMKLKPYIELVLMDFAEDDVPFPMHKNRLSDKKK